MKMHENGYFSGISFFLFQDFFALKKQGMCICYVKNFFYVL